MLNRYQYTLLFLLALLYNSHSLDFSFFRKIGNSLNSRSGAASAMSASKYPIYCEEEVMSRKAHGTCEKPVMKELKWSCDWNTGIFNIIIYYHH